MKYDDIILECPGNCDECNVYLECQYQTSAGQEKEEFLKKLLERDEAIKSSAELSVEEPAVEEEILEAPVEEVVEIKEVIEEPAEVVSEEAVETEEVIESEEVVEEIEKPIEIEEPVEVSNYDVIETTTQISLTPISKEEVEKIYSKVFGLSSLTESTEAEVDVEPEAKSEVEVEVEPEVETIEVNAKDDEVLKCEEDNSINAEVTIEDKEDSRSEVEKEELTPPTEEEIDAIFTEVFKLNEERTCVSDEIVVEPSVIKDVTPIVCENAIIEEEKTVTPITSEDVDRIYAEVFNLAPAKDVIENIPETIEEVLPEVETEAIPEVAPEEATVLAEAILIKTPTEVKEETLQPVQEAEEPSVEEVKEEAPATPVKETFKLVPPENNEELMQNMCAKRGRKLIYKPSEAIVTKTFKVLGTDKKNDIGEKIKDILDAEIKQGVKVGYLDKFDGLSSAEIKEEYENDIVYEFADQEFKKTGVIYDGKKIKVYVYDWDGKACHHVGYVDASEAEEIIPYLIDKEKFSFDVCGIITGGKGKRVVKEGNNLKIIKEKGDPIGLDVDIAVLNRKD